MPTTNTALRSRHSKDEWRQLVHEFQQSGLSHQQFCVSHSVSLPRLQKWADYFSQESSPPSPSPFMDLGALDHASPAARFELRLDLGSGVVLTLSRS